MDVHICSLVQKWTCKNGMVLLVQTLMIAHCMWRDILLYTSYTSSFINYMRISIQKINKNK